MHLPHLRLVSALAATLAACALATTTSAQVIQSWNFNDANGTVLTALAKTGTASASFASDVTGLATDGAGALDVAYNSTTGGFAYANIGSFLSGSGIYRLSVTFASWNITNGGNATTTARETFYVALRSAASQSGSLVADISLLASPEGVDLRFRDSAVTPNFVDDLPNLRATPLTVDLTLNRAAGTYDISYTTGGQTFNPVTGATLGTTSNGRTISFLSIGALGDYTNSDLRIDSVTFSAIPEPASAAGLAAFAALGLAATRRRRAAA